MKPTTVRSGAAAACAILAAVCSADAQTYFSGWAHTPEGAAMLALDPLGRLVVSNIGSSGLDGVTMDYPTSPAHSHEWTDYNIHDPGLHVEQAVTSEFADGSELLTHHMVLENIRGFIFLSADNGDLGAAGGPTDVRVEVLLDGQVQGSVVVPQGTIAELRPLAGAVLVGGGASTYSDPNGHAWFQTVIPGQEGVVFDAEFASGLVLQGDAISVGPAGGPLANSIIGVTKTTILAANVPQVVIGPEGRVSERLRHKGRGVAHVGQCPSCTLTLGNIGSSGDDGVEFELKPAFADLVQPPDPIHPPDPIQGFQLVFPQSNAMKIRPLQDRVIVKAVGDADGPSGPVFDTEMVALSLRSVDPAFLDVQPDFSMLGATSMRVEAYRNGAMVLGTTMPLGVAAQIPFGTAPQVSLCWLDVAVDSGEPTLGPVVVSMGTDPGDPWQLDIPGGPSVAADALHMAPIGNTVVPTELTSLELTGMNLQPFDIDLSRTQPTPIRHWGNITLKRGVTRSDLESMTDSSGQTQKVIVRGWNPSEKKEIVAELPSPRGVEATFKWSRQNGSIIGYDIDGSEVGSGATASLGLSAEVLGADRVALRQDPAIPLSPMVGIVEARLHGVAMARTVLTPPFPPDLAEVQLMPGADVGATISTRGFENAGSSIFHEVEFEGMTAATLAGASAPVAADQITVEYRGLMSSLYPLTRLSIHEDTGGADGVMLAGLNLIAHEAVHTARGTGGFLPEPGMPTGNKLFVGGLSWGTDDGVTIGHTLGILHEHQNPGALPEVDDEVLVEFEAGDPLDPVVIGALWNADFKTKPNGSPAMSMMQVGGERTADAHEISATLPFAITDHTVTVLNGGAEAGSYVVFGDGVHGKRLPTSAPPSTPDGIIQLAASTSDADGSFRVKVKFPWIGDIESPDGTVVLAGDEMLITALPVPSFAPFEPVRLFELTGRHVPDLGIADVRTDEFWCRADVTTQGAGAGDPGYGVPDGFVTASDINFFVNAWLAADAVVADLTTQGAASDTPLYGVPDGLVTAADLNYYVNRWIAGCP